MHLHWQTHGGDGPHLLLVHGFLCSQAMWLWNIPALRDVCRPVTVELWGHGHSPSPDNPNRYSPQGLIEELETIREQLGIEDWLLLGYSLGAGLTIRYALQHPERVRAHLFTNSTSGFADAEQIQSWRDGADASAARILAGGRPSMERIPVHPRHAKKLPGPIYEALLSDAELLDPLGVANIMRYTNPHISVRGEIQRNSRPALLICGSRERRFRDHRNFAATHMPLLEIVDLEAGHGMNMEAHEAFNTAACEFIA
ncbi:MAG: alpha/beta fold hydrolase, partial [Gammaproteobacteria bacterium]|nr:alpha/beta fold hydrolase [Gammaproteobacteria bacterium]